MASAWSPATSDLQNAAALQEANSREIAYLEEREHALQTELTDVRRRLRNLRRGKR